MRKVYCFLNPFFLDEYKENFYRDNTIEAVESNFSINNNETASYHCLLYIAGGSKVVHPGGGAAGDDDDDDSKLVVLMQLLVYNYDRYTKVL